MKFSPGYVARIGPAYSRGGVAAPRPQPQQRRMYYDRISLHGTDGLEDLGIGVKAKIKVPKQILKAADEVPAARVEFGRFTTAFQQSQQYAPWFFLGGAALVVWLVLVKGSDTIPKKGGKK